MYRVYIYILVLCTIGVASAVKACSRVGTVSTLLTAQAATRQDETSQKLILSHGVLST